MVYFQNILLFISFVDSLNIIIIPTFNFWGDHTTCYNLKQNTHSELGKWLSCMYRDSSCSLLIVSHLWKQNPVIRTTALYGAQHYISLKFASLKLPASTENLWVNQLISCGSTWPTAHSLWGDPSKLYSYSLRVASTLNQFIFWQILRQHLRQIQATCNDCQLFIHSMLYRLIHIESKLADFPGFTFSFCLRWLCRSRLANSFFYSFIAVEKKKEIISLPFRHFFLYNNYVRKSVHHCQYKS